MLTLDARILDDYGARLGPYGLAVYLCLVRQADAEGQAAPALAQIAQCVGISSRSALRAIQTLRAVGLVTTSPHRRTHVYRLLPLETSHSDSQSLTHRHSDSQSLASRAEFGNKIQDLPAAEPGNGLLGIQGLSASLDPSSSQIPPEPSKKNLSLRESQKERPPAADQAVSRLFKRPMPETLEDQEALKARILMPTFLAWIERKQLTHLDLDDQWDAFVRKALANGYRYASWYSAFQNWLTSPYQDVPPARASPAARESKRAMWEAVEKLKQREEARGDR